MTDSGPSDRYGRVVTLYEDVREILYYCEENKMTMALASRTEEPSWAGQLIQMLGINQKFKYQEIFPSSKTAHFNNRRMGRDFEFEDMLFYDDEIRNIREVGALGVTSIYVEDGLNMKIFKEGLRKWQNS